MMDYQFNNSMLACYVEGQNPATAKLGDLPHDEPIQLKFRVDLIFCTSILEVADEPHNCFLHMQGMQDYIKAAVPFKEVSKVWGTYHR